MTQIEDLVRQALAETPAPTTSTDPLATLDRRVRRARRRLAAGAGVVTAVVAAAVAVPLAVLGGDGSPNSLEVARTPSPSPSVSNPPGVTTLWSGGAQWVAGAAGGEPWLLIKDDQGTYVGQVGQKLSSERVPVDDQSSRLAVGEQEVWVWGTNLSGTAGMVTVIPSSGPAHELAVRGQVLGAGAVSNDALYVISHGDAGAAVYRYELTPQGIVTSKLELPVVNNIVTTGDGHVWAQSDKRLVEVNGMQRGAAVEWEGDIYGPASPGDAIWAYDGRLIDLTPKNLLGCMSCAEGYRVFVSGQPDAALQTPDGLFVAIPEAGLDYYSPRSLRSGNTPVTTSIHGIHVVSLSADPAGGVDYVDDHGDLNHWQPQAR
jgi:hypothetical protein